MSEIQFTCADCGEQIEREKNSMDIDDIQPARCVNCTLTKMKA